MFFFVSAFRLYSNWINELVLYEWHELQICHLQICSLLLFFALLKLKTCVICNAKKRTFNKCVNFISLCFFFGCCLCSPTLVSRVWRALIFPRYNLFIEQLFSRSSEECLFSTHKCAFYVDTQHRAMLEIAGSLWLFVCSFFLRSRSRFRFQNTTENSLRVKRDGTCQMFTHFSCWNNSISTHYAIRTRNSLSNMYRYISLSL